MAMVGQPCVAADCSYCLPLPLFSPSIHIFCHVTEQNKQPTLPPSMMDPISLAYAIIALTSIAVAAYVFNLLTNIKQRLLGIKRLLNNKRPSVKELYIYPIKSCGEISLSSAKVTPIGFEHDRILQVVSKAASSSADFSFCTPREKRFERLFHIKTKLLVGNDGTTTTLELTSQHVKEGLVLRLEKCLSMFGSMTTVPTFVTTMGAGLHQLEDCGTGVSDWLQEAIGIAGCRLVGIGEKFYRPVQVGDQGDAIPTDGSGVPSPCVSLADEAPFLLTTLASLKDLNKRLGKGKMIDMRRFRPNIVIDGLEPWEEDSLKRIRIGKVEFHVWQRCGRCTMTTIDRDTLKRCGEPLSTLSTFRERDNGQRNFGMHLIPCNMENGKRVVCVGDEVEILEYDEGRRAEWMRLFSRNKK